MNLDEFFITVVDSVLTLFDTSKTEKDEYVSATDEEVGRASMKNL